MQLSRHGRDVEALQELYTTEAILVVDEARENLVSHLLALSAVEFSSFSTHYPGISVVYRVTILTSK
jgi:hypothetical protein